MATDFPSENPATAPPEAGKLDAFLERAVLVVVMIILIGAPLAVGATRVPAFLGVQGLTILALGLWAARLWTQPGLRIFWPPVCWAVLAFVLYAIIRCQFVEIEYLAHRELIQTLIYAVLFVVVLNNLNRRESATVVALGLIALGMALASFAIFQFATQYPKIWMLLRPPGYLARGSGTYINPNHLAGCLEMIAPLALAYTVMGRFSATVKVILGYAALVILVGIGVTLSRGGIIATLLTLAAFCLALLLHRDYWLRAVMVLAVCVVVAVVFSTQFSSTQRRFDLIFSGGKLEDGRTRYWSAARQIYEHHVLWGADPGHFDQEFWLYRPPDVHHTPKYAHNDYLNTLCDWGTVGLGIVAAAMVLLYAGVFRTWAFVRKPPNELGSRHSTKAAFVFGAALGLMAILLHSVVDFNMHIPANAIIAVTLMALLSAHLRFATERFWINPGAPGKVLLTLAAAATMLYLTLEGWRNGEEYAWLQRAETETSIQGEAADLKKAYAIAPENFQTCHMLGEIYRLESWAGDPGYEAKAREAMVWFGRALAANPYHSLSALRYGMCLDWLDKSSEATRYYQRAHDLDPNNAFIAVYEGWHYVHLDNYPEAKKCLERSLSLDNTELARDYLDMVNERIARAANPTDLEKKHPSR